jgi:hypothetical protein
MTPEPSSYNGEDFDDYTLISGFYGPGALGCWYIGIVTFVLNWLLEPYGSGRTRHRVTPDFIAAVLHPLVLVGHLLVQIAQFPKGHEDYLVVNLVDALYDPIRTKIGMPPPLGTHKLDGGAGFGYGSDTASDMEMRRELFPRVVAIKGILTRDQSQVGMTI